MFHTEDKIKSPAVLLREAWGLLLWLVKVLYSVFNSLVLPN